VTEAVEAALERGRKTAPKKPRYEPVDVEWRGRLVARIRDTRSGEVEGVYYHAGSWLYYGLGRRGDKVVSHAVRDAALKRMAKAMIGHDRFVPGLIEVCHAKSKLETERAVRGETRSRKKLR
jgi:hypothetical protein